MPFTHLHVHTQYSLLDGTCKLGALLDKAKSLGQTSLAITDHGAMYGAVEFYEEAKKRGIKPVIGCECYVAPRSRKDKVHTLDGERYHLILLCKNNEGYRNLIKMVGEAWVNGFYVKPRIDRELIEKYHAGIVCLSGCLYGEVARLILRGEYDKARETALWYKNIFGEDYYIEIQNHGLREQQELIPQLIKLSRETDIPLAATNDVHYIEREDSYAQRVLICIQTNHTIDENSGFEFTTDDLYLKSEDEMRSLFPQVPEAVDITSEIADKCNVEFEFGKIKLPFFDIPGCTDHYRYFRDKCYEGLYKNVGENPSEEYTKRLDYELEVVNKMGYVDYYLIVHDFVDYAKRHGIPVGPGRGSGAGSLAAYCIGITEIDPMKYDLLFERFLNPERVSMPDFDIDFCYIRRDEVINYVNERYGSDHVAQIVTFGTLAAKAAVRDVGRALGMPYAVVDAVAKSIPNELKITLEDALNESDTLKEMYNSNGEVKNLIDTAMKVEGLPRHTSTHAAGVVITDLPVNDYVPLAVNDEVIVTQYTMTTLEKLGLLKMDFLGLRTLTVIDDAVKLVREKNPGFDIKSIDINDAEVYKMLSKGETLGVFQYESAGMRNVLMRLKPRNIEDMIAVVSLFRPGPAQYIDTYIENSHHPEKVTYKTPLVKDIFDVTYGCMVYQEQVMQVCRKLAGYSYGRADLVRRAMSKKKADVMESERKNFIYGLINEDGSVECEGCVKRGVDEKTANEIFDEMSSFARYAFNKSHAAAYAYVAYQTAYLKCHYPCELMAATLTSVLDRSNKVSEYIEECNRLSIEIKAPDINTSFDGFTVHDSKIYFGLRAIKNIGKGFINTIVTERERSGDYKSFYSFCKRTHGSQFNKRAVESLIKCGAFDSLGLNRRQMLVLLPEITSELDSEKYKRGEGQIGFFDVGTAFSQSYEPIAPNVDEYSKSELLEMEKEMSGLYFSGHPMSEYKEVSKAVGAVRISDILLSGEEQNGTFKDEQNVRIAGLVTSVTKKTTKNNSVMLFITLEDVTGAIECLVFASLYDKTAQFIRKGSILLLDGRLSLRDDKEPAIVASMLQPCPKEFSAVPKTNTQVNNYAKSNKPDISVNNKTKRSGIFLRLPAKSDILTNRIINLVSIFDGNMPVYMYYEDEERYEKLPSSLWIQPDESLLRELKHILGDSNVVLK